MASAEFKEVQKKRVVTESYTEKAFVLTLTPDEAATLYQIVRNIEGDYIHSRRVHTSAIKIALRRAGVDMHARGISGTIRCAFESSINSTEPVKAGQLED